MLYVYQLFTVISAAVLIVHTAEASYGYPQYSNDRYSYESSQQVVETTDSLNVGHVQEHQVAWLWNLLLNKYTDRGNYLCVHCLNLDQYSERQGAIMAGTLVAFIKNEVNADGINQWKPKDMVTITNGDRFITLEYDPATGGFVPLAFGEGEGPGEKKNYESAEYLNEVEARYSRYSAYQLQLSYTMGPYTNNGLTTVYTSGDRTGTVTVGPSYTSN